jgi:catechol 2,3-dioxygenase-like lactoylglutathione lyase family enzyme
MQVLFVSSVAVIAPKPHDSRRLYVDSLGLPLDSAGPGDEYLFTDKIDGSKHFGVWPLEQAAQACFGTSEWPADRMVPQMSIEFEVASIEAVSAAAEELAQRGYPMLHPPKTEPWGQTVARIQTPEGAILGLSYAPWMHPAVG